MSDRIMLGATSGVVGGTVGMLFSYAAFLLGLTPMSSIHLAATLTTTDVLALTPLDFVNAIFTHLLVAGTFGVLLTYMFLRIGLDYWVVKGLALGALFCLITHSYLIPLVRLEEQIRGLIYNTASWSLATTTHMIIGLTTSAVIVHYHRLRR